MMISSNGPGLDTAVLIEEWHAADTLGRLDGEIKALLDRCLKPIHWFWSVCSIGGIGVCAGM